MAKIEGGCLCGNIRYTSAADPLATVICHCINCQKQSGGAYSLNLVMPRGSVDIHGEMTTYVDTGDSGNTLDRNFCGRCASVITSEPSAVATITVLKAGTLDDASWVRPVMEIYCDSAQPWTREQVEMVSHPKMMPS